MKAKKKRVGKRVVSNRELDLIKVRTAVADYMHSEGCGCCEDRAAHDKHTSLLGKMLLVRKYSDGSGYDFNKYLTTQEKSKFLARQKLQSGLGKP